MTGGVPEGAITAAEYARRCDPPMGKPAMSRLFGAGLPNYPGKDDHGRNCKFVLPSEANRWRASFCTPKMDGRTGLLRGAPDLAGSAFENAAAGGERSAAARRPSLDAGVAQPASPGSPAGGAGAGPGSQTIAVRIQEARATSAEEDAQSRRYKRLALEGLLLDRRAAIHAHLTFVGMVASTLDRMPADWATKLAGDLGVAEHAAYLALRKVSEGLREDLARASRAEGERLGLEADEAA